MGQYYNGVILSENKKTVKAYIDPHSFNSGSKLTEHSYIGDRAVAAFEHLIFRNPQIVVWAGDYAEKCEGYATNIHFRCNRALEVNPNPFFTVKQVRFVVNHTKGVYVDKDKIKDDNNGWRISPLPILTCEGNGRGGGDFWINPEKEQGNVALIGSWARDMISTEDEPPKDYQEIIFDLVE
jgi:hypothetical protein